MITIVEPKEYISKLWGKQKVKKNTTYRLMKYVLQVDHDGKVLLHNVVTGQLVLLSKNEVCVLKNTSILFSEDLNDLIEAHYLVPESFDEHSRVVSTRTILRKLESSKKTCHLINKYTILPTTDCNARCYYCFEQGVSRENMSAETAANVVAFISNHCDLNKDVHLSWFGGEPTIGAVRISQICRGLKENNIRFNSEMTTNGYLLSGHMIEEAVELWKLRRVMICFDGTENSYNKAKAYCVKRGSPYKQVLNNIASLLEKQINVQVRMNFDIGNYLEFKDLIREMKDIFKVHPNLSVTAHPINGEHTDNDGRLLHGSSEWFDQTLLILQSISREEGMLKIPEVLPNLRFMDCEAASDSAVTITPRGMLVNCPEQFQDDEIMGNLKDGIVNHEIASSWKILADYPKCTKCVLFPYCIRFKKCSAGDRCEYYSELIATTKLSAIQHYKKCMMNASH